VIFGVNKTRTQKGEIWWSWPSLAGTAPMARWRVACPATACRHRHSLTECADYAQWLRLVRNRCASIRRSGV